MKKFEELPLDAQKRIKSVLSCFDKCYVVFECGNYEVSSCIGIKSNYASDHEFIGTYSKDDIYNEEEQIINYVENFHDYPIEYKGKRDYKLLNELTWEDHVKFDENGNIVKI